MCYPIANIFRGHNIDIVFKAKNCLYNYLLNCKDMTPILEKNGVYKLNCKTCDRFYIGKTFRALGTRVSEHIRNYNGKSSFGKHLKVNNHEFDKDENVELLHNLDRDKDYVPEKKALRSRLSSSSSEENSQEDFCLPAEKEVEMPTILSERFRIGNASESDEDDIPSESIDIVRKWTKYPRLQENLNNFNFSQNFGSKLPNIADMTFLQIWKRMFSDDILDRIVEETNRYASQNGRSFCIYEDELQAFFGTLIIMGLHKLPGMRMYWSYDQNYRVERVANIMSLKRFLAILRHIHLNDNEKCPKKGTSNFDKLYKLRPLIEHLNEKFRDLFSPSRELSIDESMVGFKGRSGLKQYMPMKPVKRGFKIWVMTCARTGYMLSFKVYEGKDSSNIEGTLGERTVLHLSEPYHHKGYILYCDNYFSTIELLSKLLEKKTFACGTFRTNRKFYPKDNLLHDKQLKLGESDFVVDENTGISVCKWHDRGKKCVVVISSLHDPSIKVDVDRTNKEGKKKKFPVHNQWQNIINIWVGLIFLINTFLPILSHGKVVGGG
ncbi:piggyBac transposable element-derived protein 4-like [Harmonia axyridis]|uniref:piggyBac transposable element-derived protein 4-like n=1 Tax=Harmonia axyridis TaxID=115357 RepID=UPI001E279B6B|nr:piggyBac transposable element-derived protein 4-like [Harmonia axyridis]